MNARRSCKFGVAVLLVLTAAACGDDDDDDAAEGTGAGTGTAATAGPATTEAGRRDDRGGGRGDVHRHRDVWCGDVGIGGGADR